MVIQQSKGRTGMEIGAMLAAMVFMLTLSFQAGIQYGETQNLKIASATNRDSINRIEAQSQTLDGRMSRVEQLLSDIKDTLQARGYKQ
jgi:hypothetical protein